MENTRRKFIRDLGALLVGSSVMPLTGCESLRQCLTNPHFKPKEEYTFDDLEKAVGNERGRYERWLRERWGKSEQEFEEVVKKLKEEDWNDTPLADRKVFTETYAHPQFIYNSLPKEQKRKVDEMKHWSKEDYFNHDKNILFNPEEATLSDRLALEYSEWMFDATPWSPESKKRKLREWYEKTFKEKYGG